MLMSTLLSSFGRLGCRGRRGCQGWRGRWLRRGRRRRQAPVDQLRVACV